MVEYVKEDFIAEQFKPTENGVLGENSVPLNDYMSDVSAEMLGIEVGESFITNEELIE